MKAQSPWGDLSRLPRFISRLLVALAMAAAGLLSAETLWDTAEPETRAVSRSRLDAAARDLAARNTKTFLVVRNGKIVYEWHSPDPSAGKPHYTSSLAKALVGGTSLLLPIHDGRLHPDDPAWKYIPSWRNDPLKSRITIRHLATHSSGIADAEQDGLPHNALPGWKGAFWKRDPDPFSIAIRQAPLLFHPGSQYAYSNPGMAALAYAVTAAYRGSPYPDLRRLLEQRVMAPLGIGASDWSIGYGVTYELDGLRLVANWGGGGFMARATARIGQWVLQRGEWNNRQLVKPELALEAVSDARTPLPRRLPGNPAPASGLGWNANLDGVWPKIPRDAFAGAGQQVLLAVPSVDLILVRNGGMMEGGDPDAVFWGGIERYVFNPVMEAVAAGAGEPPYPPSSVIRKVTFGPLENIRCAAPGSDNWPITWAGDDHLYASYGDGWGFQPLTEKKLSQGFARVAGSPENFRGENIRSPSGERLGDGAQGAKASGLLAVGGVLYAWVRNTGNSQLIWSEDRGRTWRWGFGFGVSFGSPAFLNFGRNYQGARDGYVYTYSQDGPSAYESNDRLVLARVPQGRIRHRSAYEFFVRLEHGRPVWTNDIEQRGAVFTHPGKCRRVDAVYNPGLGRDLLALAYDHEGGWGIFDAPEPWGPWTTAFHTTYWGVGVTHGYRLPSKWISLNGRTMFLVFSGRKHIGLLSDDFCVRKITLEADAR